MSKAISSLAINLTGNIAGFAKSMQSAAGSVKNFASGVATIATGMIAASGVQSVFGAIAGGFSTANSLEQTSVALETMTGSAQSAAWVMQELKQFAASTPFEFPELADSAKKLIAFGISTNDLMPSLKAIGDISAGVGVPVSELSEIFGKAKTSGKLMAEDINQLTGRGIPIIGELAKQFNVSTSEVKALVSEGKVGFPQLQTAFQSMTGEGGQFNGMMEKQSKTMGGLLSTLSDTVTMAFADMANSAISSFDLKGFVAKFTSAVETVANYTTKVLGGAFTLVKYVLTSILNLATGIIDYFQPVIDAIWTGIKAIFLGIVDGVLVAVYVLGNLGDVAQLAFKTMLLGAVTTGNYLLWVFGTAIPTAGVYFYNNFVDIFKTIGSYGLAVMQNLAGNIVKIMTNIPELVSRQTSFSKLWTPMTEGAQNYVKEAFQIPEREIGDYERKLSNEVGKLSTNVFDGMASYLADSKNKMASGIAGFFTLTPKDKLKAPDAVAASDPASTSTSKASSSKAAAANKMIMAGSAEALRLQFGSVVKNDIPKKQLQEQQTTNALLTGLQRILKTDSDQVYDFGNA